MEIDMRRVDALVGARAGERGRLIEILLDLQAALGYLPRAGLERVAETLDVPLVRLYALARFYRVFRLEPPAAHAVGICTGTACYTRHGGPLLDEVGRLLHAGLGETTEDGRFAVEALNCPGACPAGPLMTLDGVCHGRVEPGQVEPILRRASGAAEVMGDA